MAQEEKESILNRAKKYSHIKYALTIIETIYLFLFLILFLGLGFSSYTAGLVSELSGSRGYLILPAYLLLLFVCYCVSAFPLSFYGSFILEHQFSLTKQKFKDWLLDQLKAGVISYMIGVILFGTFYYILKRNPGTWWVIISLFWIFFSLILAKLVPVLIIPLFFKYKPLSDKLLRERVINLAGRMKVKIMDVFEIDFSKKTLKANAAFVGWGKTRRVILADTLKDKYTYDEIEVILTHEFAHYRMKHLLKLILMNAFSTILFFYLIFRTNICVLGFFGLSKIEDIASFPLIIIYLVTFGIITQPLENYISRCFERSADREAIKISGLKEAFISMMNKLSDQNLSDRAPHPIIKFFFFDHPPVNERINMARSL